MSGFLFYTGMAGFVLGVAVRTLVEFSLPIIAWGLLLAVGVAVVWRRNGEAISAPYLLAGSLFIFCAALGALRFEVAEWSKVTSTLDSQVGQEVTIRGVIAREPDLRERTQHLYTKVEGELVLVTSDRFQSFEYGDEIVITGELMYPETFETDLGRIFNYPGYLEAQGARFMMRFAEVKVVSNDLGNPVLAALLQFKHAFMRSIETVIPEPQVGLAEGLLLGVKRALGEELTETFRKTGIIHIVVLSGYNVMLVVAFVLYILAFLLPLRARVWFGLAAITAFALMVGLSATVVRASIMAALILIAKATGRTYAVLRALAFAAALMVFINPYILLYDPGFQLSILATMGLILVAPYLERYLQRVPTIIGVREFLVATLATQLFVLPLLLYQIGEFSIVSVVVNVLVLPMVPVAMLLTFITGLVGFVSVALAMPLAWLTTLSLTYILLVAEWFAALPFAAVNVPTFSVWWVMFAYGGLSVWLWWPWRKQSGEVTELRDWTIVEERENESDGETTASPSPELPVFFR